MLRYLALAFALIASPAQAQIAAGNLPTATSANGRTMTCALPAVLGSSKQCTPAQIVAATGTAISGTASATADVASIAFQNSAMTAAQIYAPIIPHGYYFADTVRAVADVEPGTMVQNYNAFGAYTYNNVAQGTSPNSKNAVGLFVNGVDAVNGAYTWGINSSCGDNSINGLATLSGRGCIGYEADFTANGSSVFEGISLLLQGPGTPASANGVQIGTAGTGARWVNGFIVNDGAVTNAAGIFGATATTGASIPSAPLLFNYFNSSAVEKLMLLQANNDAFSFSSSGQPDYPYLQSGNGNIVLGAAGTDTNVNLNFAPKGSGSVIASSLVQAKQFLTLDGTSSTGAQIGASVASGTSLPSQPIYMSYFNASAVEKQIKITGNNAAFGVTSTEFNDGLYLQTGAGNVTLGATGADTNVNLNLQPQGSGQTVSTATVKAPGYIAGTTAGVSCAAGTVSLSTMVVTNGIVTHC